MVRIGYCVFQRQCLPVIRPTRLSNPACHPMPMSLGSSAADAKIAAKFVIYSTAPSGGKAVVVAFWGDH